MATPSAFDGFNHVFVLRPFGKSPPESGAPSQRTIPVLPIVGGRRTGSVGLFGTGTKPGALRLLPARPVLTGDDFRWRSHAVSTRWFLRTARRWALSWSSLPSSLTSSSIRLLMGRQSSATCLPYGANMMVLSSGESVSVFLVMYSANDLNLSTARTGARWTALSCSIRLPAWKVDNHSMSRHWQTLLPTLFGIINTPWVWNFRSCTAGT